LNYRYLGCDKAGELTASAVAVSSLESFTLSLSSDAAEVFELKTQSDMFIGIASTDPVKVRGEAATTAADTTHLRIRMHARFKPRLRQNKADRARETVSRRELESAAGRKLEDDEVRRLKRARREGDYHEQLLMVKVKGKHDKYG